MIVGTAGHIDHGKTALVRRLTGVETDRLKEEKQRGISIDLGFAYWPRPGGETIGFVDVPGHEGLVHNMLAGATGIDFVMLVVAADDGIMPQTREHLAIMHLLSLKHGVVALNKADLVDAARLEAAKREIEAELGATSLAGAEIIPVSAITGQGLDALAARIDAAGQHSARRPSEKLFRLAVDRCFTLAGLGTAVTGTVISGNIRIDDHVIVSPAGHEARVRSIHAQNVAVTAGRAGQRCALVLNGPRISKETVQRGDMIVAPAVHMPTTRIDARLDVLASEPKPIGQWWPVKLHHGAAEVPARVVVLSDTAITPGTSDFVQLVLERPIAAAVGDRFVLRDTSSRRTVGGGTFLDLRAPERRRRTPQRRTELAALEDPDPAASLSRLLDGPRSVLDLTAFLRDRGLPSDTIATIANAESTVTFPLAGARAAMSVRRWDAMRAEIANNLSRFHAERPEMPGLAIEQLRLGLTERCPPSAFMAVLKHIAAGGSVVLDRSWARLASHKVTFSAEEERIWALIAPKLSSEPYRPPRVRDIARAMNADEGAVRRIMLMAARRGDIDEIAHDHFFLRQTVEGMAAIAADVATGAPSGAFSAADFRNRLDNGRKVAIQILEFFDRHGFTMRRNDLRRINPHRRSLFLGDAEATQNPVAQAGGGSSPVGRPDFKSGWGRQTVLGGFDSHPSPPTLEEKSHANSPRRHDR